MAELYKINKELLKKCRAFGKCLCSIEDKKCPCDDFLENDNCECGTFIKAGEEE